MTGAQARRLIQERLGAPAGGAEGAGAITVPVAEWQAVARFTKEALGCRYLSFLTAVDWKEEGLEIVARIENLDDSFSLTLKTRLGPARTGCPSLVAVYRGADWMERECYDMFGIRFDGHPDLRRILLPQDWDGHPLLKSYALDTPHPPYR